MSVLESLIEKPLAPQTAKPQPPPKIELGNGDYVDVLPYNAYNDPNCRQFLFWFYDRMRENGLLRLYYPDLTDDDKMYPTFVRMLSSEVTHILLVVVKDSKGEVKDVIGLSSWEAMKLGPATVGHCGFIFRQEYWTRKTTIAAGHKILEWWFEHAEPRLDIAIGLIAEDNTLALRYVQGLGWDRLGVLDGCQQWNNKQCDAVMYKYTRGQYERNK